MGGSNRLDLGDADVVAMALAVVHRLGSPDADDLTVRRFSDDQLTIALASGTVADLSLTVAARQGDVWQPVLRHYSDFKGGERLWLQRGPWLGHLRALATA